MVYDCCCAVLGQLSFNVITATMLTKISVHIFNQNIYSGYIVIFNKCTLKCFYFLVNSTKVIICSQVLLLVSKIRKFRTFLLLVSKFQYLISIYNTL